jgi:hypothetical protein
MVEAGDEINEKKRARIKRKLDAADELIPSLKVTSLRENSSRGESPRLR